MIEEIRMHILLVEDERMIANYVKRGLEEQGYAVDIAFSGEEALIWATGGVFDLIVLDIMLPPPDGIEVCKTLRRRGLQTPILMLTARDTVDDRVVGLDAGADDYLVKPFELKELLARLRALTRRTVDAPKTPVLQTADLILDPRILQVTRAGCAIDLTSKEYAVLECLMRAGGSILTREIIADHVWSYDVANGSNVIDVYIRTLRRKIDDPYEVKLIQTVRGTGYRLLVDHDYDAAL
jgi:DNA-binding response OmpR family regulator